MKRAALGSAVFFALAPSVVAGLIPWFITRWDQAEGARPVVQALGAVLVALGVPLLVHAFVRFVVEGGGTPAPVAPTDRLVIGGLYRHVRNPMYLAVGATILGQALLLERAVLLAYLGVFGVTVYAFVRLHEEPALGRRYGGQYDAYRRAVPGWWPRRRPWTG